MYKLYARPGSGSAAIEAILSEAGAQYEVVDVERRPDRKPPPDFLKINPLGQVPTLILENGEVMTESAAMMIHLADNYPAAQLAPPLSSPERATYLRWMIYLAANIYMTDLRMYYCERYTTDPKGADGVKAAAIAHMAREWDIAAEALGKRPYFVGDKMSAVDIYAAMLATWNPDVPAFFARHANVKALYDRVAQRPHIAAAWKRNGMEA